MASDSSSYPYNLPVSFHFKVDFGSGYDNDAMFQEVGGLSAEIGVEELVVGGENMFTYRLPTRAKYANLVLKRGMILNSNLIDWFKNAIEVFESGEPGDGTGRLRDNCSYINRGEPSIRLRIVKSRMSTKRSKPYLPKSTSTV